ncbi:uncharacterized protein EAE98_009843 [Botrytis deweyae]|uniref:NAD(P)-binding domain-containing protein n=1 Tax=Botrytis deweyae TaxID=2478750 RepID=A0ABQ7IAC4_9HELO|nr:uncharacterized protein EAE98_009843 [Botrytis deweyae]KAF7918231.1 hypothetical protein EAE98_009843 [Botrytis deweyae]
MSSSEAKTIGIAGVGGKFAQCIIKSLLLNPSVHIKGYCRNASKLPTILTTHPRIKIVTGSYDDITSIQNFVSGTSVVICCYFASTEVMTNGQKYLINACEAAKVPRYIAGDFSVDHTLIPSSRIHLFPKPTTKIIEYLSTKKSVKGVHILNGALMETFWAEFFQLYDSSSQTLSYWGAGDEKWEFTTYQTAADYTAAVALDENAVGIFRFLEDRKSPRELQSIFQTVYSTPLHLKSHGSLIDLEQKLEEVVNTHGEDTSQWGALGFAFWCTNGKAYLGEDSSNLENSKYPKVKNVTMEQFLKRHALEELPLADQSLGFA